MMEMLMESKTMSAGWIACHEERAILRGVEEHPQEDHKHGKVRIVCSIEG
jgi:hypothetical protein